MLNVSSTRTTVGHGLVSTTLHTMLPYAEYACVSSVKQKMTLEYTVVLGLQGSGTVQVLYSSTQYLVL